MTRKHHEDSMRNPRLNTLKCLVWALTLEHSEMRTLFQNITVGDKSFVLPAHRGVTEKIISQISGTFSKYKNRRIE